MVTDRKVTPQTTSDERQRMKKAGRLPRRAPIRGAIKVPNIAPNPCNIWTLAMAQLACFFTPPSASCRAAFEFAVAVAAAAVFVFAAGFEAYHSGCCVRNAARPGSATSLLAQRGSQVTDPQVPI